MGTLILCTLWTLAAGFIGYSIAAAKTAARMRSISRDNYYLKRWLDQQVKATTHLDLELELERIRNAR